MDLDKVAARLRPRTPWEAIDLGFVLARSFFKPIALGWLVCVLPLFVLAAAVSATTTYFWLPLAAVWLLKPLYDRIPLVVLSRAFFGEVPSVKQTTGLALRSWRGGAALADITWRRFSPFRGVTMPVRELEKLGGAAARERINVLLRRHMRGPTITLMLVSFATEVLFVGAIFVLASMVTPESAGIDLAREIELLFDHETNQAGIEVFTFAAYFVAMSAVEIFFAAASFGLYINRRVRLEGWDIEIVFKRLAGRLRARAQSIFETAAMVFLVVFFGLSLGAEPVHAQHDHQQEHAANSEPAQADVREVEPSEPAADPQDEIEDILDDSAFGGTRTEEKWQVREDLFDFGEDNEDGEQSDLGWLEALSAALGMTFQIVMWIVAGVVIVAALIYFFRKARLPEKESKEEAPMPGPQTELVSAPEEPRRITLPSDIVDTASAHWQAGEYKLSLSVLYRGTIEGLADGYRIEIDPSLTARECVSKVRDAGGPADYVAELAEAWTATVYADRRVDDERARELFANWRGHFRRQP